MNPNSQNRAPILTLSHDILWTIFRLNTNLFEETGLTLESIRTYSQVCQEWREFILHSPSLWGRVIDLRSLKRASYLWRNEVLQRSWGSVLWIKGYFPNNESPTPAPILDFLYETLNAQWNRVQRIDVIIPLELFDLNRCQSLYRSAPKLEIFRFGVLVPHPTWSIYLRPSGMRLFAHNAPLLQEFNANKIPFALDGPWLSHLLILSIGYPVSIEDTVRTLQMMPRLEKLEVSYPEVPRGRTSQSLPRFTLPMIKNICLYGHLLPLLTLLEHFKPSDGCSVDLTVSSIAGLSDITAADMTPLKSLGRVMQGYLRRNNPDYIDIARLSLGHVVISNASTFPKTRIFSLEFNHWKMDVILSYVFAAYLSSPLITTNASKLELDSLVPSWSVWTPYLSSFNYIDTLYVHNDALTDILRMQGHVGDVLFPCLKVLVVSSDVDLDDDCTPLNLSETSMIIQFLRDRIRAGYPIKTLDLRNCNVRNERSYTRDLDMWRCSAGLKIIYPKCVFEDGIFIDSNS